MWNPFRKKEPKRRIGRAPRYVYIVALADNIENVTTRNMMRVAATSKEAAKSAAIDEVKRKSGIDLRSSDVISVTGGRRRA